MNQIVSNIIEGGHNLVPGTLYRIKSTKNWVQVPLWKSAKLTRHQWINLVPNTVVLYVCGICPFKSTVRESYYYSLHKVVYKNKIGFLTNDYHFYEIK